jgi:hypothetical protein
MLHSLANVDKISFYLSRNDWKRGKIMPNVISIISVQGSLRQSKAEVQAEKNWLSQTCLSILEIFWYLWYPGDPPRDAESLGRSLYYCGGLCRNVVLIWFVHEEMNSPIKPSRPSCRLQYWSPFLPYSTTGGYRLYRRSRCIFLGCNVSTNDENMHWFQQMKINITHISLLKTRPQSQRSAAPWGSRQRNKTITRRKQESDFVGREKRGRARKRTHWFRWERRVNVFANQ